jgi:hypothetical protein
MGFWFQAQGLHLFKSAMFIVIQFVQAVEFFHTQFQVFDSNLLEIGCEST